MQLKKALTLLIALALVIGMANAVAQDEETNDRLAHVVMITPKEGHAKALEEAITKYHYYMADKQGAWRYQWYAILTGPNVGKYLARSGDHNWADFDAEHDWNKEAGEKFRDEVRPHIADMDITITKTSDEVGIWPESNDGYKYFSVTQWYIHPGHGRAFNEGLKKIDAALKEGGWPSYYAFINTVSGGSGNSVTLVSPRKSYADMAPKEPAFMDIMNKAMGEEETEAFMADWSKTWKAGQNQLLMYRADLSDYGDG